MARLTGALESAVPEVRQAALASLEKVHGPDSPEASLTALGVAHADLRKRALLRLYAAPIAARPAREAALRWRGDDPDPEVRRVAFLLSLHTREKLLGALRERDPELNRQLTELESGAVATAPEKAPPRRGAKHRRRRQRPRPEAEPAALIDLAALTNPETFLDQIDAFVRQGLLAEDVAESLRRLKETNPNAFAIALNMLQGQLGGQMGQGPIRRQAHDARRENARTDSGRPDAPAASHRQPVARHLSARCAASPCWAIPAPSACCCNSAARRTPQRASKSVGPWLLWKTRAPPTGCARCCTTPTPLSAMRRSQRSLRSRPTSHCSSPAQDSTPPMKMCAVGDWRPSSASCANRSSTPTRRGRPWRCSPAPSTTAPPACAARRSRQRSTSRRAAAASRRCGSSSRASIPTFAWRC